MNAPFRRGTCPGLSAPMQTGDGLLVRLLPIGTISLAAFIALCAAAREHGNGVVEVTARGSIQVRGLSPVSAPRFAAAVAALGIAAADGIAVHASPLAGLDPDEILDAEKLAADVRCALAGQALAVKLAPKIAVTVDGGGALGLDGLSADVRLRAVLKGGRAVLALSVGGDRAGATDLVFVAPADAALAVARILETIAQRGRDVRARDIIDREGVEPFGLAVRDFVLIPARPRESGDPGLDSRLRGNERKPVIGTHPLRDGLFGCGVGLAFGHADATSLADLTKAAAARGATGLRAAPDRALIFVGFSPDALGAFVADAAQLGFIVRPDDPRRFVVACAGAPICASAHIAGRALAPRIAVACADSLGARCTIHLSGCAKGCAHPAPAALTVVGTAEGCGLVANGTARDVPFEMLTVEELPAALARHGHASAREPHHV
jgi:precorrin-3B synthase